MKGIYSVGGVLIFHDPGPEMIPVISGMDPSFRVHSIRPKEGFVPKFQGLRVKKIRSDGPILDLGMEDLKRAFCGEDLGAKKMREEHEFSCLQVVHAVSLGSLSSCRLCGWNCGVNRFGEKGRCGLGSTTAYRPPFIHIAEEPVINPAVVTNLAGGCACRCQYCIDHEVWDASGFPGLDSNSFWQEVGALMAGNTQINTLEFTNPTESLHGVIEILSKAPNDFNLPVVFNCHLYGSREFYELGGLVTDAWLPDLRYGNSLCAKKLSKIDHYMEYAKLGLDYFSSQNARVIVRVLVLPGHVDCCHKPALELLSGYKDKVWVSILDQYVPEHEANLDPDLRRRPTNAEIAEVRGLVERYGLRDVCAAGKQFWEP